MSDRHPSARAAADSARAEEEGLRERWEATLRERLDAPISVATTITRKTLALFPVRVWRHFLQHNGFLLAAGVSYQALFSFFAVIYVAFAGVGLWLGGSPAAVQGLIGVIDSYIPGLIRPDGEGGVFTTEQVTDIATGSTGVLAVTVAIIMASAFSAILVYAQDLLPGRVGLVAGMFFGVSFGLGGLGAAALGEIADHAGIEAVYKVTPFLLLLGLLTAFLPRQPSLTR